MNLYLLRNIIIIQNDYYQASSKSARKLFVKKNLQFTLARSKTKTAENMLTFSGQIE